MKVFDFSHPAKLVKDIPLPGLGAIPKVSGDHEDTEIFFQFTSFTDPRSVWRVDMNQMNLQEIMTTKLSNFAPNMTDFATDQVWFESKDGTKVPMFIVRKKSILPSLDAKPAAPLPTILYGYGGFNTPEVPFFNLFNLVYLNNINGMFVVANIRGGGEFGDGWHKSAILENK